MDFLALQAKITIKNSKTPRQMKEISSMLKTPKDLHIQMARATKATAQMAKTKLSILRVKNKQLFPPLV